MTPLAIEILIKCVTSTVMHENYSAPAVIDTYRWMAEEALIEQDDVSGGWRSTDRGELHLKQLCELRFPIKVWIGYDGERVQAKTGLLEEIEEQL